MNNIILNPKPLADIEDFERAWELNDDETAVVREILDALVKGREKYGPMNVMDERDYRREAFEEDRDWLVYRAAEVVRNKRSR